MSKSPEEETGLGDARQSKRAVWLECGWRGTRLERGTGHMVEVFTAQKGVWTLF